jgi:ActR/RegA family two-component response regulator
MKISFGLLLSDDLIFTSRIVGTARAHALELKPARTVNDLIKLAADQHPSCLLVDLQHSELNIEELAGAWKARGVFLVGYGSHVDAETLRRARTAGFDVVWPRSKFAAELETALPQWFAGAV